MSLLRHCCQEAFTLGRDRRKPLSTQSALIQQSRPASQIAGALLQIVPCLFPAHRREKDP